jgi:multidrug resistance efflux pump
MIPFPYNLIAVAVMLAGAFFSGWQTQGWHRDSLEKDRAKQELAQAQASAAANIRRTDNVIAAQNAAATRETMLRRDASSARSELERLRGDLSHSAGPSISPEACRERTTALEDVLLSCAGRYSSLAEKADRHASDVETLMNSWPTK